jgi:hypothetical protein
MLDVRCWMLDAGVKLRPKSQDPRPKTQGLKPSPTNI